MYKVIIFTSTLYIYLGKGSMFNVRFLLSSLVRIISDTWFILHRVLTMTRCEVFMECGAVETKKGWEGAERSNIIIIIGQPVATWSFTP